MLGSGWLGKPLAQHFANSGFIVSLSTRSPNKIESLASDNITSYLVDIDNITADSADFLNSDTLIIAITSKNIKAYQNLIAYIERAPIKYLIFISSSSVYKTTNDIVTEQSNDENAESVLLQIETLFRANPNFTTTILRLSGLVGYSRHPGNFFANGKLVQHADAPVNLIHQDDCIGIIDAIINQDEWGEVFNACADTHPTKRLFYSHARALLGSAAPSLSFADTNELEFKIVSNNKVKQQLNYQFIYPDVMTIPFGSGA
ncbi:MAG: NAD(P)H-binding protein [Gammaproteobacteria bacterium]|nr:NAD(P)H-binding protein [Gammaproteobacteria bacterium]